MSEAAPGRPRIVVVADDLIWATRIADGVRRAGGEPVPVRRTDALDAALAGATGVIVDTSARAYDPIAVLRTAAEAGVPSIAVAPHEAADVRRSAKAAGASRVHPYRVLFERGDRELAAWVATLGVRVALDEPPSRITTMGR
jgi:hypothetical protein